MAQSQR